MKYEDRIIIFGNISSCEIKLCNYMVVVPPIDHIFYIIHGERSIIVGRNMFSLCEYPFYAFY